MESAKRWAQSLLAWTILLPLTYVVFLFSGGLVLAIASLVTDTPIGGTDRDNFGPGWIGGMIIAFAFIQLVVTWFERWAQHRDTSPKIRVEVSIRIARPIAEVFAFVADEHNEPRIEPRIVSVNRTSAGPVRVGTTYHQVFRLLGWRTDVNMQVVAYEPPTYTAARGLLGYRRVLVSYRLVPVPKGTSISFAQEVQTSILNLPGIWITAFSIRVQLRGQLRRLKRIMESAPNDAL